MSKIEKVEKLYSTEEIAKLYGVTNYTITQTWCKRGLRHIRGKGKGFNFRISWVEEYLEMSTMQKDSKKELKVIKPSVRIKKKKIQFVV